ncbi:MAG: UDP-N-acetylmuramate dehydrogenase, partial [Lachnospiraceae bacterium]|nr:UDP-N-acetylmuramate dehydrogenase [Lachnospiraceae bacterium]
LPELAREALSFGLSGLEFASGIPGSVGGGLVMNAGAYGSELKNVVTGAELLFPDGSVRRLSNEELQLSYRHSVIPELKAAVLSADFRLEPGNTEAIREKMEDLNSRRREKQPLNYGSAGSTFKRPPGYFAGKLIEDAGLKGLRIGDAAVSEKHAGFVINHGNACASDVYRVICHVQRTVKERFGVRLEREVILLGSFPQDIENE